MVCKKRMVGTNVLRFLSGASPSFESILPHRTETTSLTAIAEGGARETYMDKKVFLSQSVLRLNE